MRLDAGIDHQRAAAAPVLVLDEGLDAMHVGRRVGAREGDPEEVIERAGGEVAVVHDEVKWKAIQRRVQRRRRAEPLDTGINTNPTRKRGGKRANGRDRVETASSL